MPEHRSELCLPRPPALRGVAVCVRVCTCAWVGSEAVRAVQMAGEGVKPLEPPDNVT